MSWAWGIVWPALLLTPALAAQQTDLFERDVKPLITANCLGCHNRKIRMSGLSLASRQDAMAGGKRGPVLVPGRPAESRLLKVLRHQDAVKMPPGRMLAAGEIDRFERWIAGGVVWPEEAARAAPKPNHWSFKTPKKPPLPPVKNTAWPRSPVDRFILARLEKEGIAPSPEAPKTTLIRRAYLDLIGLLPSPEQVRAFLDDTRSDAWERVIDGLLASPHYGERWGRRWLDYARYADSDAGSRDEPRQIWRYRDWVIHALNRDLPFDRFVLEQLAGDLLPQPTDDQLIATGFHRNSVLQIEAGTDREQYRVEAVFDRVDTTGTVFLGLSVGCARCHDHKYDPITHREYYRLFAFFNTSDEWGNDRPRYNARLHNLHQVHAPLLEFASPEEIRRRDQLVDRVLKLEDELEKIRRESGRRTGDPRAKALDEEIKTLIKQVPRFESSMIMRELPQRRDTHVFLGGDFLSQGERVDPGTPSFLHPFPGGASATRLDLARWLVDPENPLLARVTVNRIWQEYFGRGIVETENDFGTQGAPPTHPELLDWLSVTFVESGWSRKAIHRLITTSAAYRQSSHARRDLQEKDPRNYLLARQSRLRLDAEIVRDAALSASGLLAPRVGGPSVFPPQPAAAMQASQVKKTWTASTAPDRYRRGMYTFFWRVTPHPSLVVFDAPNSMTSCTRRTRSNTPLQALAMLNELAFHEFAQGMAERLVKEIPAGGEPRMRRAFELCLSRQPDVSELERLRELLAAERDDLESRPEEAEELVRADPSAGAHAIELAVWTALSRVLLNTDEFMTRE
ncbi:MAG: PSD1 domain-containing protein [Acidobacteria bacterium]|nr:PSD1 domain-containing protein [Acidobacteriota bacterium]